MKKRKKKKQWNGDWAECSVLGHDGHEFAPCYLFGEEGSALVTLAGPHGLSQVRSSRDSLIPPSFFFQWEV